MQPLITVPLFNKPVFLIPVAFFIWTVSFWGFLSGKVPLTSDAISYYEHTKFFIDQICSGQFPLWDPNWSGGVPNDFFLRRIGSYNPFYFILISLNLLGVKFFYAYMIFQCCYFFFGMTGFYLLSQKILKSNSAAFLSFLTLTFSVLGSRIFDSYMLLVTIPTIWFFYFLVSFFKQPGKGYALGVSLTTMVLLTTYIPLFFLVIFLSFIVVYSCIFGKSLSSIVGRLYSFINENKLFVALCVAAMILAVIPGLTFFSDSGRGDIAIPGRHYNTEVKHVLAVEPQQLSPWSIMEELFFSSYFTDLSRILFAVVYVPFFALMVVGVGFFIRINRLFLFLCLWILLLLLFSMPIGFPLYNFLYTHSGFVQYFRNLHFLLWFIVFPLFALFIGLVWKQFALQRRIWSSWTIWVLVISVHSIGFFLLLQQQDALGVTFLTLILSASLYISLLSKKQWAQRWINLLLLIVVIIQPVVVFTYLVQNYQNEKTFYAYDILKGNFSYTTLLAGEVRLPSEENNFGDFLGQPNSFYYTTDNYRRLSKEVDPNRLNQYEHYKFYMYDHKPDNLSEAFLGKPVRGHSKEFQVKRYGSNRVEIQADLPVAQFIVFNDANHWEWAMKVNGKNQEIITANAAFKGFWLSAGKSEVILQFGSIQKHLFNWFLMGLFYGMFVWAIVLFYRRRHAHP